MHIHMIINVVLPTPFPHLILILSNGLLNQKIISSSFFSKNTCMVPFFFFLFFIYLLNSKAIVQPLLNLSLQFYWNGIYILGFPWLRFKVKCSMGWLPYSWWVCSWWYQTISTNIRILLQVLHRKLGHAPSLFWFGLLQIITAFL
jgi:hypothetical protein